MAKEIKSRGQVEGGGNAMNPDQERAVVHGMAPEEPETIYVRIVNKPAWLPVYPGHPDCGMFQPGDIAEIAPNHATHRCMEPSDQYQYEMVREQFREEDSRDLEGLQLRWSAPEAVAMRTEQRERAKAAIEANRARYNANREKVAAKKAMQDPEVQAANAAALSARATVEALMQAGFIAPQQGSPADIAAKAEAGMSPERKALREKAKASAAQGQG